MKWAMLPSPAPYPGRICVSFHPCEERGDSVVSSCGIMFITSWAPRGTTRVWVLSGGHVFKSYLWGTSLLFQELRFLLPVCVGGMGSIPGWGDKIPLTQQPRTQNIKQTNKPRSNIVTNSIKTLKNGSYLFRAHGSLLNLIWKPGWEGSLHRIDICICMAESLWCSPEITTTLLIGYTPIQNKKLKKNSPQQQSL